MNAVEPLARPTPLARDERLRTSSSTGCSATRGRSGTRGSRTSRGGAHVDPARLDERTAELARPAHAFRRGSRARLPPADAQASATLRRLQAEGVRLGVFTDAPAELARIALSQLGAARRIDALEAGPGALERLLATLGPDAHVLRTIADLHS